tara:strand:+ start:232 stop:507 length:276 start_codon:yes stop_codon:yes gene_type:complete
MSNVAEKLPRFIREPLEDTRASIGWWVAEARRSKFADQVDSWVNDSLPKSVVDPLREDDRPKMGALKTAAGAAGDELLNLFRDKVQSFRQK